MCEFLQEVIFFFGFPIKYPIIVLRSYMFHLGLLLCYTKERITHIKYLIYGIKTKTYCSEILYKFSFWKRNKLLGLLCQFDIIKVKVWNFYNPFFIFYLFKGWKVKYLRLLWSSHGNFFSELFYGIYLQVL